MYYFGMLQLKDNGLTVAFFFFACLCKGLVVYRSSRNSQQISQSLSTIYIAKFQVTALSKLRSKAGKQVGANRKIKLLRNSAAMKWQRLEISCWVPLRVMYYGCQLVVPHVRSGEFIWMYFLI